MDDPTKYGVVVMDEYGQVQRFVEKPKEFVGDKINAGEQLMMERGSTGLCDLNRYSVLSPCSRHN